MIKHKYYLLDLILYLKTKINSTCLSAYNLKYRTATNFQIKLQ